MPAPKELEALLRKGRYQEVDTTLNALQAAFERRELPEKDLRRAFALFEGYQPKLTAHVQRWAEAHPGSYAAHLALGAHLASEAWWHRTYRRAMDVPEKNWARVAQACEGAAGQLNDAMRSTAEPSLAAATRMELNTLWSQDTWDGYIEAVQRCPTSLAVRLAKIGDLRPEWGGSIEGMYAFLQRPEHASLSDEDRLALHANVLHCEGHHLKHFQNDIPGAIAKFEASLAVQVSSYALSGLADALESTDIDWAEQAYRQALALEPYKRDGKAQLGLFVILHRQQYREGMKLVRQARAAGSPLANDFMSNAPRWLIVLFSGLALFR